MRISLTKVDGKNFELLPFDIEFFYDDRGITIIKTRDNRTYKVIESIEEVKSKFFKAAGKKFYEE